jgi:hypothetical protein
MKTNYDILFNFYNDYQFLKKCLININKQSILAKKIIFTDDGNNDSNLKKLVRRNLNKKIRLIYIKNKKNLGPEKCTERAAKYISSKFFYNQSTDDLHFSNFAKYSIQTLIKYPKAPYVFSNLLINNLYNKKLYKLKYFFLKKNYFNQLEVINILKSKQFKIYHNTVMFNSKIYLKDNIQNSKYGPRSDMLNLFYLASKYGFAYINKNLSAFTFRKNQYGKILSDISLIKELIFLKSKKIKFYQFLSDCNLNFDISIFSINKLYNNGLEDLVTIPWFCRSIKFWIWKKVRFVLPKKTLQIIFRFFS